MFRKWKLHLCAFGVNLGSNFIVFCNHCSGETLRCLLGHMCSRSVLTVFKALYKKNLSFIRIFKVILTQSYQVAVLVEQLISQIWKSMWYDKASILKKLWEIESCSLKFVMHYAFYVFRFAMLKGDYLWK